MLNPNIIEPIEQRLASRPGPRSRLSVKALLAGIIVAAKRRCPYSASAVAEALSSLTTADAAELGLEPGDLPKQPISYEIVRRRLKLLEDILAAGWTDDEFEFDLVWFTEELLTASLPDSAIQPAYGLVQDGAAFPTWSLPCYGSDDAPRDDDGRAMRTKDPDARTGYWHTADWQRGGIFEGYYAFLVVRNERVPYIVGLQVESAGPDSLRQGSAALSMSNRIAPNFGVTVSHSGFHKPRTEFSTLCENPSYSWDTLPELSRHIAINATSKYLSARACVATAWLNAGGYFERDRCRRLGLGAHSIAALAAVVALNLQLRHVQAGDAPRGLDMAATTTDSRAHSWQRANRRRDESESTNSRLKQQDSSVHDSQEAA